jgi:hypothetical protein
MFGTPEALQTDETLFDQGRRTRLLRTSALTFGVVGLGVWLSTIFTGLLLRQPLSGMAGDLVAGLEGFLLIIFAVALENTFVRMLGFAGSFGEALKRRNRWLWLVSVIGITFLFYHTLLNPRGELAAALQEGNVRLFLGAAAAFVLGTFGLRMVFKWQERRSAALLLRGLASAGTASAPGVPIVEPPQTGPQAAPASGSILAAIPPLPPQRIMTVPDSLPVGIQVPVTSVSINGMKQCPVCCNQIKAEAMVCSFCKATFTVAIHGYCLKDHAVVEASTEGKCTWCGAELTDLHVESGLLKAPQLVPFPAARTVDDPGQVTENAAADTRECPSCGETINADAHICPVCQTRLA